MSGALKYQRIGKYEVVKKLGEGATSEVYLCHDTFSERDPGAEG